MCYKNPGPRCDLEVLTSLTIAQHKDATHKHRFIEEHCELLMTRGGLTALAQMVKDNPQDKELLAAYKTGYLNYVRKMNLIGKTFRKIPNHPDLDQVTVERDVEKLADIAKRIYHGDDAPLAEKAATLRKKIAQGGVIRSEDKHNVKVIERAHASLPSLKDISIIQMKEELQERASKMPVQDYARVMEAASLAEYLHRTDVRKTPSRTSSGQPRVDVDPYIIHPLRNTIRLARWGSEDPDVYIASLLHDTVEDHGKDLSVEYCGTSPDASEEQHRAAAYRYISRTFGPRASHFVDLMSNPLMDKETKRNKPVADKIYADHVRESVQESPQVLILKVADFVDNALSAHQGEINRLAVNRSKKYAQLVPIFSEALEKHKDVMPSLVTQEGADAIGKRVSKAKDYLESIISMEGSLSHQ